MGIDSLLPDVIDADFNSSKVRLWAYCTCLAVCLIAISIPLRCDYGVPALISLI